MSVEKMKNEILEDEELLEDEMLLEEDDDDEEKVEEEDSDSDDEEEEEVDEEEEEDSDSSKKKKDDDDDDEEDDEDFEESFKQIRKDVFAEAKYVVGKELGSILEEENLSEEFQKKAITVFEHAVTAATRKHLEELDSYISSVMESAVESKKQELEEQTGRYMDYVIKEWREENHLAIQSGVRTEIAESFMVGLSDLLEEHYITLPEEKEDLYNAAVDQVEELESSVEEQVNKNIALESEIEGLKKKIVLESFVSGMRSTKAEKIRELAEDLDFESEDEFCEKLGVLKENYFPNGAKTSDEDMITEDAEGDVPSEKQLGGVMSNYMTALTRYKNAR